jgi:hypothetical protein
LIVTTELLRRIGHGPAVTTQSGAMNGVKAERSPSKA